MKRQQSLATLENLRQKTQQARDLVTAKQRESMSVYDHYLYTI